LPTCHIRTLAEFSIHTFHEEPYIGLYIKLSPLLSTIKWFIFVVTRYTV